MRGTKGAYSAEQRLAWAQSRRTPQEWRGRIGGLDLWILESGVGAIGFAALDGDCFDLLFVHPDHAGQGHSRQLHDAVVAEARNRGLAGLVTHASHVSRPVFARFGWTVESEGEAERGGVLLGYSVMRLDLPAPA
nr:GNAT family N-acetyltransferase [Mangrovicoccus sp. HB161399]